MSRQKFMEYQTFDKFEYKYEQRIPLYNLEEYLNKLGKDGWEVIDMKSSQDGRFITILFKRKLICVITE